MVTRTHPLDELTPRQREVLALVARGMTNGQVAQQLGISLDGAKWHVSEIITRLGVDSREQAAAIWREEQRPIARLRRFAAALSLKPAAVAGGAAAVVILSAAAVVIALNQGGDTPPLTEETPPAPADTPTTGATPTPEFTSTPPAADDPSPTTVPGNVTGLFTDPRPSDPDQVVELGTLPDSPFPEHDRESVVLYDFVSGQLRDFGPGNGGHFTGDGNWMVWTSDDQRLLAIELPGGEPIDLGPGHIIQVVRGNDVFVSEPNGQGTSRVLVPGGERETVTPGTIPGDKVDRRGAYTLRALSLPPVTDWLWHVEDASGEVILEATALRASWASETEVVLSVPADGHNVNHFLVDIQTREATFIATADLGNPSMYNFNVVAHPQWVAWTERICGSEDGGFDDQGTTKVYDRTSGEIIDLGVPIWVDALTPDGRLAVGGFGGQALVDLDTFEYDVVLPDGTLMVQWSADYRYASRGVQWGHGGYCA